VPKEEKELAGAGEGERSWREWGIEEGEGEEGEGDEGSVEWEGEGMWLWLKLLWMSWLERGVSFLVLECGVVWWWSGNKVE
jgi:hypothetical protein